MKQQENKIKYEDLFDFYIVQNHIYPEVMSEFGISRRELTKLLKEYNIHKSKMDVCNQNRQIGKKSSLTQEFWSNPQNIKARHDTIVKNNRLKNKFCRSNAEQSIFDALKVDYPELKYDIKVDDRYPFYCDFYIESLDLFIEY